MKIYIHTLGCKTNQYESQAVGAMLEEKGHELISTAAGSDAIIVNTCAVTAESVRKSRQAINKLRKESPGAIIAVCGCWPQAEPEEARKLGVDILYGSGSKAELVDTIASAMEHRARTENIDAVFSRRGFEELPAGSPKNRTRALLKIEDGCANFCTYCIIPYTRGVVRSLPMESAARKARDLTSAGYREIVLTGIEIASYGRDLPGKPSLHDVTCLIAENAPGCRIRLGSLEPRCITDDFCAAIAEHENICDHFHLSLQSGCDETLSRMHRKYDTSRFYESVTLLRKYFPNCGITADLITGFPGETDNEFSETLSFIEKCGFSRVHIFPYSVRRGTPAASMPDQVPKATKHSRAKAAAEVGRKTEEAFMAAQKGKTLSVLFEQEDEGMWLGHTSNYLLAATHGKSLKNKVCDLLITGQKDGKLIGTIQNFTNF